MSKIENLIKELCPEGVPMVKLGEVCECVTGGDTPTDCVKGLKQPTEEYPYPVYGNGDETYGYASHYRIDKSAVTISSIGNVGTAYYREPYFIPIIRLKTFIPKANKLNTKFLYYCLSVMSFIGTNSSLSSMKAADFKKREIPLPPLDVQKEIVRILDKFSAIVENLDKEIELRQKQYEYYRERLLSPPTPEGGEWEFKALGELGTFVRGNGLQKADFREEGYPCIHYGQVHTYYGTATTSTKSYCDFDLAEKLKKVPTGGLIIATTSEDVEACCKAVVWLGEGEVAYSGDSYGFIHNQNPKYMAYLFQTEMFAKQKRMVATGAKVVRVSGDSMAKFEFLFPPLARQQEIVDTLDKFEAMIANLKEERALRQKQYEYYREKLLTFN